MADSAGKECELVVVFQSRDLSVCKRMSSCRRTSVPDQVDSSRYRNRSYVILYRRTSRLSMRRWSRVRVEILKHSRDARCISVVSGYPSSGPSLD